MGRKGHMCVAMPDNEMAVSETGDNWYLALKDENTSLIDYLQRAVNATNLNDVVLIKEISDCPYCGCILKPHPYITEARRLDSASLPRRSPLDVGVRESPRWGGAYKFPRWD